MIRNLNNLKPKINPNAYVNESAYVVGEVEMDEFSSVWPGAVIRADSGKISIGKRSNIQDNSAVHSDNGSIKNTLTYRKYFKYNLNILSFQSKIGNIFSLQINEQFLVLTQ